MLIRDAELPSGARADVRIAGSRIAEVGARLAPLPGAAVLDAGGRALSVGLHDHHFHLMAYTAALESVPCGPPQVDSAAALAQALRDAERRRMSPGDGGWLRGIGYHESAAGDIDRDWLDRIAPDLPLRIQHRSGRMWIFNSCGLRKLGVTEASDHDPLERIAGRMTGRLYDSDEWLRVRLTGDMPSLARASAKLARFGVTGLTDAGLRNGLREFHHFVGERERGKLSQDVLMMGGPELDTAPDVAGIRRGPTKLYLRESTLPAFDAFCNEIQRSRQAGRAVAIHCVTLAELVFATAALQHCGIHAGDRIEHASVAPPDALELLAAQGLTVVTQPNFVFERGDAYLAEVAGEDRPWLYRGRAFIDAGIALGAGTDAPYGDANPWAAMAAAVNRRTCGGRALGPDEALSPDEALALFSTDPLAPGGVSRRITAGAAADLCLLDRNWKQAYEELATVRVDVTIKDGRLIWQR
ncbi:amidohydrolase family protein [Aromatoleum anaerobium]|uniref:Amidohydrolase family protein n=1 Tax=Aromatoleum anaerobium TaxID=182180 RepID=A0ABX1PKN5_9RHOO|nr:amidohydrolase family protein [Aromatoleum anaerobium]MCK0508173.1 amidohydrolase family protein [Aromatoleum anaerobium]